MSDLFKCLDQALNVKDWLIALDRDGTLVPYANRPEEAIVDRKLRGLIDDLSAKDGVTIAVISARSCAQLRGDFGDCIVLAGNYGMEVMFPDGKLCVQDDALNAVPRIKQARDQLSERLDLASGAILEDHGYSLCLHWHNVPLSMRDDLHAAVMMTADKFPELKFEKGNTSYEVFPNLEWNKGLGLAYIDQNLNNGIERVTFFAGDTNADTPGFAWVNDRGGISVRVGGNGDPLGARFVLGTPQDLHDTLEFILKRKS